jgi:hypothetical protein
VAESSDGNAALDGAAKAKTATARLFTAGKAPALTRLAAVFSEGTGGKFIIWVDGTKLEHSNCMGESPRVGLGCALHILHIFDAGLREHACAHCQPLTTHLNLLHACASLCSIFFCRTREKRVDGVSGGQH